MNHDPQWPHHPIPDAGSQDWVSLIAMFRGMGEQAQMRANDLTRSPEMRAGHEATASAYAFAAQMIDIQFRPSA